MAVVITNLTSGSATGTITGATTASISPSSNNLVLLLISIRNGASTNPGDPTVSGNGLTWVLHDSQIFDSTSASRRKLFLFRAMGPSPSSGAITITTAETDTDISWVVDQASDVDTSGTNGSGAIVQTAKNSDESGSATSITVTLAAFSNVNNVTYGAFGDDGISAGSMTAGTGFTITAQGRSGSNVGSTGEYKLSNDTTVDISAPVAAFLAGIAIEIKAATTANVVTMKIANPVAALSS